jgi:hypothetical protein
MGGQRRRSWGTERAASLRANHGVRDVESEGEEETKEAGLWLGYLHGYCVVIPSFLHVFACFL